MAKETKAEIRSQRKSLRVKVLNTLLNWSTGQPWLNPRTRWSPYLEPFRGYLDILSLQDQVASFDFHDEQLPSLLRFFVNDPRPPEHCLGAPPCQNKQKSPSRPIKKKIKQHHLKLGEKRWTDTFQGRYIDVQQAHMKNLSSLVCILWEIQIKREHNPTPVRRGGRFFFIRYWDFL